MPALQKEAIAWLQSAVAVGCFDLDGTRARERVVEERVRKLMGFLNSVGIDFGSHDGWINYVRLRPCEGFVDVYTSAVERLVGSAKSTPAPRQMLALALVGACALDAPPAVKVITDADPGAQGEAVSMDWINKRPWITSGAHTGMRVTAFYAAIQFSAWASIDALVEAGLPPDARLAESHHNGQRSLDMLTTWSKFEPYCSPEVAVRALDMRLSASPATEEAASKTTEGLCYFARQFLFEMQLQKASARKKLIPAMLAAGVFDVVAADAVLESVHHGYPDVVRHFRGRMPWADLWKQGLSSRLALGASEYRHMSHQGIEDAALVLVECAVEDHEPWRQHLLRPVPSDDGGAEPPRAPVLAWMDSNFRRVLLACLESGLDPSDRAEGECSPLDHAESSNAPSAAELAALMRAFVARRKTASVLAALDLPDLANSSATLLK
ncbi:hypothetical protein ACSFA0_25050 [Variovorax sp. LT1P1]